MSNLNARSLSEQFLFHRHKYEKITDQDEFWHSLNGLFEGNSMKNGRRSPYAILQSKIRLAIFACLFFSCARFQVKDRSLAMRPLKQSDQILKQLEEGSELKGLRQALQEQLAHWDLQLGRLKGSEREDFLQSDMIFGPTRVPLSQYRQGLMQLSDFIGDGSASAEGLRNYIDSNFDFYEVYGGENGWGSVLVTGYYEPLLKGFKHPQGNYTQPLYLTPKNLVTVRFDLFAEVIPSLADWRQRFFEQSVALYTLRGQVKAPSGDSLVQEIVPFPDRRQIDGEGVLKGQGLEICYVDPIDAFFLQIQGSGKVVMADGSFFHLTYAAQNGHTYYPIGKELLHLIPKEEITFQKIVSHLRELSGPQRNELLFKNPSYVFFRKSPENRGITFQGTPVADGRTIATDKNLFPKGAMAILEFERPIFKQGEDQSPSSWSIEKRIVFDQDTGGAIRGPGRVDLFWGSGKEAEKMAGVSKNLGRLIYLLPKSLEKK
jgi:membrane-bound lytic murein transglycosylase A